jgi:hypothetical protein
MVRRELRFAGRDVRRPRYLKPVERDTRRE